MENYPEPFFFERGLIYFIEKRIMWLLIFVLLIGFVSPQEGWGEFTNDIDSGDVELVDSGVANISVDETPALDDEADSDIGLNVEGGETSSSTKESVGYTQDFWIALGLGVGAMLLFLLLLFLLLKRSRNRWKVCKHTSKI